MKSQGKNLKFANMVITYAIINKYPDRTQDQIANDILNVSPETFSRWRNGRKKIGKQSIITMSKVLESIPCEIAKAYNDLLGATFEKAMAPACLQASFEIVQEHFKVYANEIFQSDLSGSQKISHDSQGLSTNLAEQIHVNLDTTGRNEALGFLANEIVKFSGTKGEKLAHILLINAKFNKSKSMLENFLGIGSPTVSRIIYDYSEGTKRSKSDIERLISAGIDIEAIRDYGTSAFREAAKIFSESPSPIRVSLLVAGDPARRKLFIKILREIIEEGQILGWVDVQEHGMEYHEENLNENGTLAISKIAAALMPVFEAAKLNDPKLHSTEFLVERVISVAQNAKVTEVSQWITLHLPVVPPTCQTLSRTALYELSVEQKSCERILALLATKQLSLISELIVVNSRKESQIATLLLEALDTAAKEKSHLSFDERVELRAILKAMLQIRSGVISPEKGIAFFEDILKTLSKETPYESSICMYQISYYYFQLGMLEMSQNYVLRALDYDDRYAPALCFRAVLEIHEGHHDVAIKLLEDARDSDNSYVFSHFYMGVLFDAKDDSDSAIASYIRCLIISPNFYEAALNLTNSLLDAGLILDAARWVSAFLSKYSAPALEFQTSIAVGLFNSGHSKDALKLLKNVYNQSPSSLVALNIAKIYFGRAQKGMCKEWIDKVLASDFTGEFEKKEARRLSKLAKRPERIMVALATTPEPINQDEKIGDALSLLLSQEFQLSEGTNNDIFQIVRRAIDTKPRSAEKFAPKSVLTMRDSNVKKTNDRKRAKQRRRYSENIKQGIKGMEPKHAGRKRRRNQNKNRFFSDDLVLTGAPSYSSG